MMDEHLKAVTTFDALSDRLCKGFFDDEELVNDSLIWIEFLKKDNVRTVLKAVVKQSGSLENVVNENGKEVANLLLCSAISALQLYVVDNFLCFVDGSSPFDEVYQFVEDLFVADVELYTLISDGEGMHSVARHSVFLKLARLLLTTLLKHSKDDQHCSSTAQLHLLVWCLRSVAVHQMSLKTITSSLYEETMSYVDQIVSSTEANEQINSQLKLNLLTEVVSSVLLYGEAEHSKRLFALAEQNSRFSFKLTGCLGTRTIFQSKPVSQLKVALLKNKQEDEVVEEEKDQQKVNLPRNEKLDDDTLLQDVKFESPSNSETPNLTANEQCFLLVSVKYGARLAPSGDDLLREQTLAYVYYLLERSSVWSASFSLLELRSMLERSSRRRVERSMKQIETLTRTVRTKEELSSAEIVSRTRHFYAVLPNPFWTVEKHLADLLLSLGVLKSALDVYLRLESWTEVVTCYRQLGRPDKAEEVVRRKLQLEEASEEGKNKTGSSLQRQAELHCLLGEITGDLQFYHTSWNLSSQRYARPPKMLGLHYFALKDYSTALPYFYQSVGVNAMQVDAWYRIGYISLQTEEWAEAATAYRRVIAFEADVEAGFEAWNNLSKAYIKLGEKGRAMRTLQEAIRLNFEEWKIWDNYIAVAADVGAFNEVLEAWSRLIDLKGSYVDESISAILVKAITAEGEAAVNDSEGEPAVKYMPKVLKLFGRVAATSDGTASFWRHYAQLMMAAARNKEAETQIESSRITQCLVKCHRKMLAQESSSLGAWSKDLSKTTQVAAHCARLAEEYLEVAALDEANKVVILSGGKLALNSALVLLLRAHDDFALAKVNDDGQIEKMKQLRELVDKVEASLATIKNRIAESAK